jgi:hypothetical protein
MESDGELSSCAGQHAANCDPCCLYSPKSPSTRQIGLFPDGLGGTAITLDYSVISWYAGEVAILEGGGRSALHSLPRAIC